MTAQPRDTASPLRVDARLIEVRRFFITIEFNSPHPWVAGDEVILAFGPAEYRFAALAKVKSETPEGTRFMRQSPWRPLNTRAFPRFELAVPIAVTWGDVEFVGRTVNLSFGGAAVGLEGLPAGELITVRLGDLAAFAAKVIAPGAGPDVIARIAFLDLTDDQQWEIESLILAASRGFEEEDRLAS